LLPLAEAGLSVRSCPVSPTRTPDNEIRLLAAQRWERDGALSVSAFSAGRWRPRSTAMTSPGGSPATTHRAQIAACGPEVGPRAEVDRHWREDLSELETEVVWLRQPLGPRCDGVVRS
jgi:hypothetical protein